MYSPAGCMSACVWVWVCAGGYMTSRFMSMTQFNIANTQYFLGIYHDPAQWWALSADFVVCIAYVMMSLMICNVLSLSLPLPLSLPPSLPPP